MSETAVSGGREPSPSGTDVTSIGAKLAAAREALDLSVADVARQIKISVPQVEALEANDLSRLPRSPVIVKGFLRNYAKLVHLDPDALLGTPQYTARASGRGTAGETLDYAPLEDRSRSWGKPFAAVILALIAVVVGYASYTNQDLLRLVGVKDEEAGPATAPVETRRTPAAAPEAAKTASAPTTTEAAPPVSPFAPAEQAPALVTSTPLRADASPTAAAVSGQGIVHFTFNKESWVEIRDRDGTRIFSQTNKPGTVQSVQGIPPLQLVVGNASGVKVTWNEQPVDLAPYTVKADIARFTLE